VLLLLLTVTAAGGCGDGRPGRVKVSGQVLIDGEPVPYGYIRFIAKDARPAGGQIDEQGHFTLSCYEKDDGIIPGVYGIEVNGSEEVSNSRVKWHAPKKYFNYKNSGLTQEIAQPTDALIIELTWDGGKPFVERSR
jgi:hypothetical protein